MTEREAHTLAQNLLAHERAGRSLNADERAITEIYLDWTRGKCDEWQMVAFVARVAQFMERK